MSIPPQASFSSETTAVASHGTAYPSFQELTSFKLPLKDDIVDSTIDDVPDHLNGLKSTRRIAPNPSTPRHPSPVSTETSDGDLTPEDTPSTVHGESMFYPRHPLANLASSIKVPASPRWPFQNVTPRTTVMVPISQSITSSSRALNLSGKRSTIGHVSVSESLDEFQTSHPNAKLLSLHPRPLTYNKIGRNLAKIPELVEKPEWNVQPIHGMPMEHYEKPRRPSPRLFKIRFRRRRRHERHGHSAKPQTFWYQRISVDKKIFRASASITMFFLINSFVSASALITLTTARLPVPHGIVVWVIVSLSTCAFTLTTLCLMRKFRNAVIYDEERGGHSPYPEVPFDVSHMCNMDLPASPTEILHRRQLGTAAAEQEKMQAERTKNGTIVDSRESEVAATTQPCPAGPFGTFVSQHPRDAVAEDYWTDDSVIVSAGSETSSTTAVIPSPPKATVEGRRTGMFDDGPLPQQEDDGYGLGDLELPRWDEWLAWD
ncbi:hypothetical protein CGRA01v4_14011 [Colletotrichum graminicola]|uniref:Transmembrane protein n=1 Tax=Colletotrichum graminicola (strain M1.001 / M2 / FGSC 10212) TaxID=645133 RepID=E3QYE8_COLGM|nr:uncharacterized protein GLRG_11077 [Colletotrichum graminicola M1.001]EFQ35886.1 hypothetical protein GLRG_11077 [Colletotrichum graminicola M1.001]WDK22721.1 hypothetical protein CGRA01v4_14011 [Colletotrichum graminicola]